MSNANVLVDPDQKKQLLQFFKQSQENLNNTNKSFQKDLQKKPDLLDNDKHDLNQI